MKIEYRVDIILIFIFPTTYGYKIEINFKLYIKKREDELTGGGDDTYFSKSDIEGKGLWRVVGLKSISGISGFIYLTHVPTYSKMTFGSHLRSFSYSVLFFSKVILWCYPVDDMSHSFLFYRV